MYYLLLILYYSYQVNKYCLPSIYTWTNKIISFLRLRETQIDVITKYSNMLLLTHYHYYYYYHVWRVFLFFTPWQQMDCCYKFTWRRIGVTELSAFYI